MGEIVHLPMATVRLFGDDLRPEEIDRLVDVSPDAAAAKGEAFRAGPGRPEPGRPVVAKTGTWFLTTRGRNLGDRPERHLEWVMAKVMTVFKMI
jgi:hypothetical protein